MARIVFLSYGGDLEKPLRRAFTDAGHDFRLIEPSFPQCKANVDAADPDAFLLDLTSRPSHVREAAAYFADLKKYRERPVLVVDADEEQVARVRSKVPRAAAVRSEDALETVQQRLAA
jgi:type VI protein secretion system component VasK